MSDQRLLDNARKYLEIFCCEIKERCVGSEGNRSATFFFEKEIRAQGWNTEMPVFDAIDWIDGGARLRINDKFFKVYVSPYSLGFKGEARLIAASNISELENIKAGGKILLLHGDLAKEQLMPKNFVFYNPEEHQKIVSLLERSGALAIITATGRNSALAGGVYPFPLIEDGDFDVPSVYMTEEEGQKVLSLAGEITFLESVSERIPGTGYNVIARIGGYETHKIVVTAHIDAKKGSPGAIDNATGVIILLLLADLLKDYSGDNQIEIVALNGEDYYAVPGQMNYILNNQNRFKDMILNINIDGAGYKEGLSAFSLFNLTDRIEQLANQVLDMYPGIAEGAQWPQGDHSIFLQQGVPAVAVSSKWFLDNINDQDITHTSKDNLDIVDPERLVELAQALNFFIRNI